MSLAGLLAAVAEDPQLRTALATPDTPGAGERDLVAPSALRPLLVAALAAGTVTPDGQGRFVLAVTATAREAEDLTAALGAFLPPHSVATFPGWETLPHERLSPRSDTVGQRIAVLRRLAHPGAAGDELLCIVALHTCPYSRQISSDSKDWAMGDFGALLEAQIPCIRRYAHAQQGMQPAPMILCSVPSSGHTGSNRRGDALPYKCTEPIRKA